MRARAFAPLRRTAGVAPLLAALALAACGDGGSDTTSTAVAQGCRQVEAPPPKKLDLQPPKAKAPTASGVTFETTCGTFTVEFDGRAPKTDASFQYLAEQGAFDDTVFHRVVKGQLIQGGDPLGADPEKAGTGGPGYSIDEAPPANLAYTRGTVAMAKTANEPIGRSGSQFFVVTEADLGLTADYALVGEVSSGFEVVEAIDALGADAQDGAPTMPVVIEKATPEG